LPGWIVKVEASILINGFGSGQYQSDKLARATNGRHLHNTVCQSVSGQYCIIIDVHLDETWALQT